MLIVLIGGEMGDAGRIYRLCGGHRKVKYMKALVRVGYISFREATEK